LQSAGADITFAAGITDTGQRKDERPPSIKYMVRACRTKGWSYIHTAKEHVMRFGDTRCVLKLLRLVADACPVLVGGRCCRSRSRSRFKDVPFLGTSTF
jgi:hypothetical protein